MPNVRRVREGCEVLQTVELDRGGFACMLGGGGTLFIVANEWRGLGGMGEQQRTGQVVSVEAPAPAGGWPSTSTPGG